MINQVSNLSVLDVLLSDKGVLWPVQRKCCKVCTREQVICVLVILCSLILVRLRATLNKKLVKLWVVVEGRLLCSVGAVEVGVQVLVTIGKQWIPSKGSNLEVTSSPVSIPDCVVFYLNIKGNANLAPVLLNSNKELLVRLSNLCRKLKVRCTSLSKQRLSLLWIVCKCRCALVVTRGCWCEPTTCNGTVTRSNVINKLLTVDCQRKCLTNLRVSQTQTLFEVKVDEVNAKGLICSDKIFDVSIA